ncbi:thaumatin-like protein 1b [Iris pallida]|uniref:Thaumatin-like protein 1b n=1 Tax=Iris pallida TaxID=29817 RepID=A0AAX6FAM1_IRIPA|nr:thaumatin-like protein 1b [Iris pallida]
MALVNFHIVLLFSFSFLNGALSATFTINNNCDYTVWPGILSSAGTDPLSTTGFALASGESKPVAVPASWSGRVWARTLCSSSGPGNFSCSTGDCGTSALECSGSGAAPPATLAEFTLNGSGGLDFYDVSLVDGYNLPVLVVPRGGSGGNCTATGCLMDLNPLCPSDLRVAASSGRGVACRSACEAFGTPEYCCSGEFGNPDTCQPSSYSHFFKNACPRAYSYAYDDSTSTFTCAAADYVITFCPTTTSQKSDQARNNTAAALPLVNDTMVFLGGDEVDDGSAAAPSLTSSAALSASLLLICLLLLRA